MKIDKKTAFAIYVVLFVVLWNLAEMLWRTASGAGNDAAGFDIVTPLILAIVTGYLFFIAAGVNINDELKQARKTEGAVIIDVRRRDEYSQGHIPGAINIPGDEIETISGMIPDMIRKHIVFHGWVQGVGFRFRAIQAANKQGVTGWVRNDLDGTVTMEIQGTEEQINNVIMALDSGGFIQIDSMDVKTIAIVENDRGFLPIL